MTRNVAGFLGLLALLPALQVRDKPETPNPAQQYFELDKEYRRAVEDYRKAISDAKTPDEKQKVSEEKDPQPDTFAPRFLELAEKYPKDPAAVDALIWIVSRIRATKSDPQSPRSTAIQLLIRDHVQAKKMAGMCDMLTTAQDEDSRHLLRVVLENSNYRPAQGHACFVLAELTDTRRHLARDVKDDPMLAQRYEAFMGKEIVEAMVKADPDKLSKEAENLYHRVVKDFAELTDVRGNQLGEMAKKKLDAMRLRHPIVVGKPAPDIEGEDIDGKKYKLSDYRGKVVLLDFWGNW